MKRLFGILLCLTFCMLLVDYSHGNVGPPQTQDVYITKSITSVNTLTGTVITISNLGPVLESGTLYIVTSNIYEQPVSQRITAVRIRAVQLPLCLYFTMLNRNLRLNSATGKLHLNAYGKHYQNPSCFG